MLVACRLAGLSALETHCAGVRARNTGRGWRSHPARLILRHQNSGDRRDVGRADPKTPGLKF